MPGADFRQTCRPILADCTIKKQMAGRIDPNVHTNCIPLSSKCGSVPDAGPTLGEIAMQTLKFQTLLKIAMLASAAQIVVPAHAEKMQLAPVHHADGCPRLGSANAEPGSCPVP
jgi:hypothetical protein